MTHTPGEWTTRKSKSGNDIAIIAGGYLIIAEAYEQIGEDTVTDPTDNALLIAAAPDMLAALEAVEWRYYPGNGTRDFYTCPWCMATYPDNYSGERIHEPDCQRQAAIAKAKGEA